MKDPYLPQILGLLAAGMTSTAFAVSGYLHQPETVRFLGTQLTYQAAYRKILLSLIGTGLCVSAWLLTQNCLRKPMFANINPTIIQIRRELRGKLPDEWLEEVIAILEYQLTYQTLDELDTNDLLELKLGVSLSPALKQMLSQAIVPEVRAMDVLITPPQTLRLPWQ